MNLDEKAMKVLEYINSLNFTTYDEFIKIIIEDGKYNWIQRNMGHQMAYMVVCDILKIKPDEDIVLELEELKD